jgi:hypothetical protein
MEDKYVFSKLLVSIEDEQEEDKDDDDDDDDVTEDVSATPDIFVSISSTEDESEIFLVTVSLILSFLLSSLILQSKILAGSNHSGSACVI